jgi:hypothetical protein
MVYYFKLISIHLIFQVPGYTSWYNVKFSGDEAIYSYRLLDDYRRGDVEIVVQDIAKVSSSTRYDCIYLATKNAQLL